MTHYVSIGKLVASFGVAGELILRHKLGKKSTLQGLEVLFVEARRDELLPYFIESTRLRSDDEIYIKLEGVLSKESAQKLLQKQVWLTEEEFQKYVEKKSPIALLGYRLLENGRVLGEIMEVIEQPHQLLCRIEWKNREALIPLHDQTLKKIDEQKKEVWVELPDGLLDIF